MAEDKQKFVVTKEEQRDLGHLFRIAARMVEHASPRPAYGPWPEAPAEPVAAGPHRGGKPHGMQHGMHPGKHRVLSVLAEVGTIGQKELQERLGISAASLSEILHKLEYHELITRKQDENDKRAIVVAITEKGAVAYRESELIRTERNKKLFAVLTDEEREQLGGLLAKLITAWHEDPELLRELAPQHHRRPGHGAPRHEQDARGFAGPEGFAPSYGGRPGPGFQGFGGLQEWCSHGQRDARPQV